MDDSPSAQRALTGRWPEALGFAGLALATPFYLLGLLTVLTFERRNPEDGMIIGFIMVGQFPLWLGLGVFLWSSLKRARLPGAIIVGTWILFALAAFAAFRSFEIMGTNPNWLSIVPILLPLLVTLFGFWVKRAAGTGGQWRPVLAIGAVALALLAAFAVAYARDETREAEGRRQYEAEMARYEAELQEHLRTETRLDGLLVHLTEEADRQVQTIAAIARLPSRQADAIRLLEGDRPLGDLIQLYAFNLEPTSDLCSAYRQRFGRLVDALGPGGEVMPVDVEQQSANLDWLMRNGCDLSPSLRRAADRLRQQEEGYGHSLASYLEEMAAAARQSESAPQ